MPARTRGRNINKSNKLYKRPCHVDKNKRFMRREWKYNKPHLRRSDSLPTLSIIPSTRPSFTCRQCHFTNTVIPMCLWCCWTSKESEAQFEESMPRARRMSAPMRISSAVETPRKRRNTEANSGSGQKREVAGGVRMLRVHTKEPTKDGLSNPVISLPGRGYRKEAPKYDMSDGRGSAADTRIDIVSQKRGVSCSQTGFVAGIEGRSSPRRSGEGEMVGQKGVGQKMKYPIKAKSCADISLPSKLCQSIAPAEDSTASTSTPSTDRPLLPLRLRRLKEVATPLKIDSQAKIPITHATKTTRKSPLRPKIFRRGISRSPSKWPSCISDVEDDRPIMIPTRSNLMVGGTLPRNPSTPGQLYPPSPRSPWSKSDPFGELLGLTAMPNPTFSLTTIPTPITPSLTRHRAATVSGYDRSSPNPYPMTPTSPSSSVYSLSGHPSKPLYSSIRKDGMYLSPLSSPRLPSSPLKPTNNPCDANNLSKQNNIPPSPYPSLYPKSPQASPLSSIFPPCIDASLSSLSLESRSSSTEGFCGGGDGIFVDAFEPPSTVKGGGHKSGLMARWRKPRRMFDGNIKSKTKTRSRSRERSFGKEDVGMSSMGTIGGLIGTVGGQTRVPPSPSNPNLMNQRLFRVPLALAGASGYGCSMSGETELKLALRARADSIPPGQAEDETKFSREDRHAVESRTKPGAGPLMRRLRQMVSTGFLRHGDGE